MQNKKIIALIILSIGAVISLTYGILTPAPGRQRVKPAPAVSVTSGAQVEEAQVLPAKKIVPTRRRSKETQYKDWGRNPFIPKGSASSALTLNGIMWYEDNPKAMINNEIVGVGDKIGSNTIVDIKKDHVVVNDGTSDFVLKLE